MDAFHLPFGNLKVKQNGDLVWLEWQPADPGVGENLLAQLSSPERERLEEEWKGLLASIEKTVETRLNG